MMNTLAITAAILLLATVAVKAAPFSGFSGAANTTSVETAQFKRKGKGARRGFKKGRGKKGPHCFSRCISKGNPAAQCNGRCR
jgi:hypothetical protein